MQPLKNNQEQRDRLRRQGWQPGQSGNPKGRPRTGHALAEAIRAKVDPVELAEIALGIARDAGEQAKDRLTAVKFLADHGWSKPVIAVDTGGAAPLDFSKLSSDQLAILATALAPQNDETDDG